MRKKDRKHMDEDNSLKLPSSSDLRGRQSVRATFKLTERAISSVRIVAAHLGIKQKSLFDHLMDDVSSLDAISREIQPDRFDELDRVQKTYVISRKTLSTLCQAAEKSDAPRDALVEYSIERLLPIIEEEREKHRKRKEIYKELTEYLKQGEKMLEKTETLLGEDDPVYVKLSSVITTARNVHKGISCFVEKGDIIEEF
ncbi:MAG: hypothetical protein JRL30_08085 [Deltaproteobacteria bacterium]|nr:hypothetical protein [Deltaproteobacteria bacterium]